MGRKVWGERGRDDSQVSTRWTSYGVSSNGTVLLFSSRSLNTANSEQSTEQSTIQKTFLTVYETSLLDADLRRESENLSNSAGPMQVLNTLLPLH